MRAGVSLLELMLAIVILALALLPLLGSGGVMHRQGFFTEHHLLATMRARTLLALAAALDFDLLDQLASRSAGGGGAEVPIALEDLFEAGGDFDQLFTAPRDRAAAYVEKQSMFDHEVSYEPKGPDMGLLRVVVHWRIGGERKDRSHSVRLSRIIRRPERSFRGRAS